MMAREALGLLDALAHALPRAARLPEVSQCRAQAEAAGAPDASAAPVSRDVVEAIRTELRLACEQGRLAEVSPRTLRNAPLVLWNGEKPASEFPGLLEHFLDEAGTRARWLGPLIEAWLRDFEPSRTGLAAAGRVLAYRVRAADHPRLSAWQQAERVFALFDAAAGPGRLADALLNGREPLAEVLRRAGMNDPLRANGGYFRACVVALIGKLPQALKGEHGEAAWRRAEEILSLPSASNLPGAPQSKPVLRFADMTGATARACLKPWLPEDRPVFRLREPVKVFLVRTLGDPRVKESAWRSVGEAETALVRRWLAKDTLDAFFALISQRSNDEQWEFRQKFWRACWSKREYDAEVWVVLDPDLQNWARTLPALTGEFGVMNGAGVKGQAVLLFRIGQTVLSEWSNVGPMRAWPIGSPACPNLYKREYAKEELSAPCLDFADGRKEGSGLWHRYPKRYYWQGRAAAFLGQREGLWLNQSDYA